MLAAIILAAGESRRMGTPKALLQHEGRTFLERLLDVAQQPKVGIIRVVLGSHCDRVQAKVRMDPEMVVINAEWPKGQLSSIQAGLRAIPEGATEGVILFLVDHPFVSSNLTGELIEFFYRSGRPIVLPTFRGRRGHPVIFSRALYQELLDAPEDVGARAVVWAHAAEVLELPTQEEAVVLNLNDVDALRRALGSR